MKPAKVLGRVLAVVLLSASVLAANAAADDPDPWEGANRKVFSANDFLDRILLKPVAKAYKAVLPAPVRRSIGNALVNLDTPATAFNQLLQGKPREAVSDTGRFLINSTVGIGGLFDVASRMGFEQHQEDFGQTFGVWGARSGNHVMLPFRGSSTVRDALGLVLDGAISPIRFISPDGARYGAIGLVVLDARVNLLTAENLMTESGDKYLFMRDAYLQRRAFLVSDGAVEEEDPFLDDFDDEDEDW